MSIFSLMVLALIACDGGASYTPQVIIATPQPYFSAAQATQAVGQSQIRALNNQAAADAAAQATLDYGQNQMRELNNQATSVSLDMAQAADAAAQSTRDVNQSRMRELSSQATAVSQNMAQAAATQRFIRRQARLSVDATATAQSIAAMATSLSIAATATAESSAATATYSAYVFNVTQTAQVQAYFDYQSTQNAMVLANQRAYALTATPMAAILASYVRTQDRANQRAVWQDFVVTPLNLVLSTLVILLLILGCVLAYQRLMPVLELRLRTITRGYGNSSLILLDGIIRDPDPPHSRFIPSGPSYASLSSITNDGTSQVEIIDPFDPVVAGWIAEAEQKLRDQGDNTP